MIQVLPVWRVIGAFALLHVIMFLAAFTVVGDHGLLQSFKLAVTISGIVDSVLGATLYFGWEWLWVLFPKLNTWIFPNLNGRWRMTIRWAGPNAEGAVAATATIRQDLISISMEVASDGSDSETMMVAPRRDPVSRRPHLYYFYRVVPKKLHMHAGDIYQGAAVLRFDPFPTSVLRGNYFTSKHTTGHFELVRE